MHRRNFLLLGIAIEEEEEPLPRERQLRATGSGCLLLFIDFVVMMATISISLVGDLYGVIRRGDRSSVVHNSLINQRDGNFQLCFIFEVRIDE